MPNGDGAARAWAPDADLLRALLDRTADGIVAIDASARVTLTTPALDRLLGYGAGELVGEDGLALVHPDDQAAAAVRLGEHLGGNLDGPDVRVRLLRADGTWAPVELAARDDLPFTESDGMLVLAVRDLSHSQRVEDALEAARQLHETVATIAATFVDAATDEVDRVIDHALAQLGERVGVDRAYVFAVDAAGEVMWNTHEWCAHGIEPQLQNNQGMVLEETPQWRDALLRNDTIVIPRVAALGPEWAPERAILDAQDVLSIAAVPMTAGGRLCGFVGLDRVREEAPWSDDVLRALRTAAGVIGALLTRRDAEIDAQAQEARFRKLVEHSSDTIVLLDRHGHVVESGGRALFDYGQGATDGMSAIDFLHPDDLDEALTALGALNRGVERLGPIELRVRRADGSWLPVEIIASNLLEDPDVGAIVLGMRDVRDRHRAAGQLKESEARHRTLIENIPGAVYRCDATPPYSDQLVSDGIVELTGYEPERFLSRELEFDDLILPEHRARTDHELAEAIRERRSYVMEYPIRHRDGSVRWISEHGQVTFAGDDPRHLDGVMFDITARKHLEDQLQYDAAHDPLTGLPNRTRLEETLTGAISRAGRMRSHVAVLFVDLDRFKLVNDALGHAAGDELLVAFAQRLRGVLRASDTATRSGGDEFVIVCTDIESRSDAQQIAERITRMLHSPFEIRGREVFVHASIGIALGDGYASAGDLLRDADVAAYRAKDRGRNRVELFDDALRAATAAALETETDLHRAIEEDQLVLWYQPIVDLRNGQTIGLEGLVRWQHPDRGLLAPGAFLDAAEASGLVVPLGRRVVDLACHVLARLPADGPTISVNLSPRELAQPDLIPRVRHTLRECGIEPGRLCMELTESALLEDAAVALETLAALKDLGIVLAIDDFGTGYSSLSYLRRLPVDVVKIDRSFVAELGQSGAGDTIVAGIVGLALGLGLQVVAEGVERADQIAALLELGCVLGQGFHFSPPVPLDRALATPLVDESGPRLLRAVEPGA